MREIKFGISWVRGVVGEAFTPELVIGFARAFGTWVGGAPVVLGRDTRRSSPMLHAAAVSGLLASGCDLADLGICPTPLVSFAVRELGAAGGIVITGSHNDDAWNALKFIGPDGTLLNAVRSEELLDIHHAAAYRSGPGSLYRRVPIPAGLHRRYTGHLLAQVDAEPVRRRAFRVAADFRHGPASETAAAFLEGLGATLVALRPSATSAPQQAAREGGVDLVAAAVRDTGADVGATLNMDGDRIAFTTEKGLSLSGEYTLPLLAPQRLRRRPGTIVTNYSTSARIEAVARSMGQDLVRAPVGESHVMDRALETGAVLAGEGSGGAAALPAAMTFDAVLSLGLLLERLAAEDTRISETVDALPRAFMHKGELRCSAPEAYRIMERFRDRFRSEKPETADGVRVTRPDGAWAHVRVSNTEPIVRIICEAPQKQRARALFDECMAVARTDSGGA